MVEPTTDSCRKKTRVRSAGGAGPLVAPEITIVPARPQRPQRVRPGGLADRLHHRVHPLRQPGAGRERLVRARARAPVPAWPRCGWWPRPGSRPARPSRISAVATPPPAPWTRTVAPGSTRARREQHPVGGQVGRRQAGGLLEGQRRGLGHQVAPGHRDALGEGAVVAARTAATGPGRGSRRRRRSRVGDDGVDHDLVAVLVQPGGVAAEHDRQPVGRDARRRAASTRRGG